MYPAHDSRDHLHLGKRETKKPCYECNSEVVGLKHRDKSIAALGTICNPLWIDATWRGLIGGEKRLSECPVLNRFC